MIADCKSIAQIAANRWNSEADEFNQWDALDQDEKDSLIAAEQERLVSTEGACVLPNVVLSRHQQEHVAKAFPECREQMQKYLEERVEVVVYLQNECGDDVPPFAVSPKDNREFWIGCWDTAESAAKEAIALGLKVVSN